MILQDTIKEISRNAAQSLINISDIGAKDIITFPIDCALLEDFNNIDIRKSINFEIHFDALQKMTGPCLYFFEILSDHIPQEIISKIREYSLTEKSRATPAIKSKIPESKILYVGKVKRLMFGRLIQHLGYFPTSATQGLQLFYWTSSLNLKLQLTVLEFEPEMINLMEVLENELAKKLKPILGKHK